MDAVKTFDKRYAVFVTEGLCQEGAYRLAEQMHNRDADPYDDRRVCFECTNYKNRVCHKMLDKAGRPQMPLRFVLQRCPTFNLKGQK